MTALSLGALDPETGILNVIIDTPKGSRNKYKYDKGLGFFRLSSILPVGAEFPFDFGYIPGTVGEDGDPVDVLVLMDEPAFPGCLVPARPVGVIEAEQSQGGDTIRNDRLVAVASASRNHSDIESLGDLNRSLLEEIEYFFVSYNRIKGRVFKPLGRFGPGRARQLVEEGISRVSRM